MGKLPVNALPGAVVHPSPAHVIERVGLPLVVGIGDLVLAGLDGLGLLAVDLGGLALHLVKDCNPVDAARPGLAGGALALFAQRPAVGAQSDHFLHCSAPP